MIPPESIWATPDRDETMSPTGNGPTNTSKSFAHLRDIILSASARTPFGTQCNWIELSESMYDRNVREWPRAESALGVARTTVYMFGCEIRILPYLPDNMLGFVGEDMAYYVDMKSGSVFSIPKPSTLRISADEFYANLKGATQ